MKQPINLSGTYGKMDNLTLSYDGNRLTGVSEATADYDFAGSFEYKRVNGSQYLYNANGSLIADKSRGIAYITYDANGNPQKIYFTNGNVTKYVYSATGQKLGVEYYVAAPNTTVTFGAEPNALTQGQTMYAGSRQYLLGGSLVMEDGMIDKFLFNGGYAQATAVNPTTYNFSFYYYNQDHLGNNREVVDSAGTVRQITHYYPFGTPYADTSATMNASLQPYKYNGKELDRMHGLDTYDYGARQYNPVTARWDRVDPLCEKYYAISPYAYCMNNPVMFLDPDGRTVEADSLSQMNIINTVTPEEAEYIQFDENGVINVDLINKCSSTSENFLSLKQLALSENNYYVFKVADKDHKGEAFYDNTNNGGGFHRGVTEMPGAKIDPSPDNNIYILVGACLSLEQQVMTTAHEAYGHGYLYDITGSFIAASHKFVPGVRMEWDKELNKESYMLIRVDTNKTLADRINIVVNQAKYNYEKRIK